MTSINELAQSILLDDVTDLMYRSISFSSFIRSEVEPKSALQNELDEKLQTKLVRQLNWSASICTLDSATHKATHLLRLVCLSQLDRTKLADMLANNYWLEHALQQEFKLQDTRLGLAEEYLLEQCQKAQVGEFLSKVLWRYFTLQTNEPSVNAFNTVVQFTKQVVTQAQQQAEKDNISIDIDSIYHAAFVNALPMLILIKLFDRTSQSIQRDKLNSIAMECDHVKSEIEAYQPSAETFLSFITFDEFLRPHVCEQIGLDESTVSNLVVDLDSDLDAKATLFYKARSQTIMNYLKPHYVLTQQQISDYEEQVGIKFELKRPKESVSTEKLWQRLMVSVPEQLLVS